MAWEKKLAIPKCEVIIMQMRRLDLLWQCHAVAVSRMARLTLAVSRRSKNWPRYGMKEYIVMCSSGGKNIFLKLHSETED